MRDSHGRPVKNLRISVTQKCNLDCPYCHKEGQVESPTEMTSAEIERLVEISKSFGVNSVKLTGGEPLLREDIVEIVSGLNVEDISLTTNGVLLSGLAADLKAAGLDRVNISCKSPDFPNFSREAVFLLKKGVLAAKGAGLAPIKINFLVLSTTTTADIWSMFDFAKKAGAVLQLIELIKFDENYYSKFHQDISHIEEALADMADKVIERPLQARKKYFVNDGEIEIVKPMHNTTFCANCTRLRLTSDGKLKPCLMRQDNCIDVLGPMRAGASDDELEHLFEQTIMKREPYWK